MHLKKIMALILIFSFVFCMPAQATLYERVVNGDFGSGLTGWGSETDSGGGSYVTAESGMGKIRASSSSEYPSSQLTQTVDFTNVYQFDFSYYASTWSTSIGKFRVYIGSTKVYETTSPQGSMAAVATINPQSLGITGSQQVKFWVSGDKGDSMTVYVDSISAMATVTEPSINSISANGKTAGDTGESPFDVTLTADVALGYPEATYEWTISPASGWTYSSGYSHSSSPQVQFTGVDSYDVTLTLTNDARPDGLSYTETDFITVTGAKYDLTVNIQDEDEITITDSATVVLTQGGYTVTSQTTTTGTTTFTDLDPGTYAVSVQISGYNDQYTYITITDSDTTTTLTMTESAGSSGTGVQYPPHDVKIIVMDGSTPVSGVDVTATVTESSGPLDWLTDWMGIDPDIEIDTTVLHGTTGANGIINFQMIQSLKYNIVITKASDPAISMNADIYPTDDEYIFSTSPDVFSWVSSLFPEFGGEEYGLDETFESSVSVALTKGQITSNQGFINVTYLDNTTQTQNVKLTLYDNNETQIFQSTQYSSDFTYQIIVYDNRGENYFLTANITHTEFGQHQKKYGITFPPAPTSFGIPEELLTIAGMAIIIFTAFFIPVSGVPIGMFLITLEAWVFYLMGWFAEIAQNAPGGDAAIFSALIIMAFLSFVVYMTEGGKR